jgi:hypothetical protein
MKKILVALFFISLIFLVGCSKTEKTPQTQCVDYFIEACGKVALLDWKLDDVSYFECYEFSYPDTCTCTEVLIIRNETIIEKKYSSMHFPLSYIEGNTFNFYLKPAILEEVWDLCDEDILHSKEGKSYMFIGDKS